MCTYIANVPYVYHVFTCVCKIKFVRCMHKKGGIGERSTRKRREREKGNTKDGQ